MTTPTAPTGPHVPPGPGAPSGSRPPVASSRPPGPTPPAGSSDLEAPRGHEAPPRLVRGRGVLAGVADGVADHLDLPVSTVRWVFAGASLFGGLGVVVYVLLWLMTPRGGRNTAARRHRLSPAVALLVVGSVLLAVGALLAAGLLAGAAGAPVRGVPAGMDGLLSVGNLLPLLAVGGGAVIAWSQLDERNGRRQGAIRVLLGAVLAVTGVAVIVAREQGGRVLTDVAFATLAVLAGLALVLGPIVMRFWQRFQDEQRTRIRETERADLAAHLHDSVLQTLALIQRTEDPTRVVALARAQERELREWLYGAAPAAEATLGAALSETVHEIEDLHGVPVDLVVTGTRPLDDDGTALVAATREALANAVRHGAPPVSVFAEIGRAGVEVFVRDHGRGFDLDAVPRDRLGVRESLFGRMERHGGTARIRRLDEGTEVTLTLPTEAPEAAPPPTPAAPDTCDPRGTRGSLDTREVPDDPETPETSDTSETHARPDAATPTDAGASAGGVTSTSAQGGPTTTPSRDGATTKEQR